MATHSTRPNPRYKHALLEPPALKKGRVTPITGKYKRHMPIFDMVWIQMIAKNPKQMEEPSKSVDLWAIRRMRYISSKRSSKMRTQPTNPKLSPATEKI